MGKRGGNFMIVRFAPRFSALALAVGLLLTPNGVAANAGPFLDMAGEWAGSGKLTYTNGTSERLRCRANYTVRRNGDTVDLSIRCASDSYKIDLSGYMTNDNGSISGRWSEPNYNAAGDIAGNVSGNKVDARAIGNTFSARLSMTTGENSQSVTIQPETIDITQILVAFRKR
jgi:hypothetical protein